MRERNYLENVYEGLDEADFRNSLPTGGVRAAEAVGIPSARRGKPRLSGICRITRSRAKVLAG